MRGLGAKLILLLLIIVLMDAFSAISGGPDPLHFVTVATAFSRSTS